ncbi:alpha/beta hydrolase [uncultured Georgenia sp.]|uniref:alpha/beta hydrolase n=1 Tax=uncultured Georgenia sp. TaxID=378209 RepID=UPI00262C1121|nr:alpha/beta hydrolase [uncultured Georgenia sp.]HLV04892.1 alpha/beta hydrolase [Actinomycetaceae bacterium]
MASIPFLRSARAGEPTAPSTTSAPSAPTAADAGELDPDAALADLPVAPVGAWGPDVLGDGFTARTVELLPDEDGDVVATVVRYRPEDDPEVERVVAPRFVMLYLHGWNDYFHQRELARHCASLGAAFYALDLRRYGRSLRPGQPRGYVESLSTYDEDIHAARDLIRADHPDLGDIVLMGHSTGGLTAALWAHRHPGALRALVLNAPWLELQGSWLVRTLGQPVIERLAKYQPRAALPLRELGFYSRVLRGSAAEDAAADPEETGDALPEPTPQELTDPAVTGWPIEWAWRTSPSAPIRPGWLAAVLAGHSQVAAGLRIDCPVLVLVSQASLLASRWSEEMRRTDTVIDVELTARRALGLGPHVTIVRVQDAIHDVLLSPAAVRGRAYRELTRWLRAYAVPGV